MQTEGNASLAAGRPRRPSWTRTADILLRTAHVAVASVLFGGAVWGVSFVQLYWWHHLTIATGGALLTSEIYHCPPHWPYQGRGVMALTHVGLLLLVHLRPDWRVPLLTAVFVFGMVGSHMTKNLRYWSFVHGRVIETRRLSGRTPRHG